MASADRLAEIEALQAKRKADAASPAPRAAAPAREEPGFFESVGSAITAPGRALGRAIYGMSRTPQTEGYTTSQGVEIPRMGEAVTSGIDTGQSRLQRFMTAAGMLTSFDPAEQVAMLRANSRRPIRVMATRVVPGRPAIRAPGRPTIPAVPDRVVNAWFSGEVPQGWELGDGKGNVPISDGGQPVLLNRPGMTATDAAQIGANVAAYSPAARVGGPGLAGVGRAALAAGGTAAALETQQSAAGGEFDPGNVAVTAAFGAGGQAVANTLTRLVPRLRTLWTPRGLTPDDIAQVRAEAVAAGADAAQLTDDVIIEAAQIASQSRPGIGRRIARSAAGAADDAEAATRVNAANAVAGEREFGIPLTRGARSGDQNQLLDESMIRAGNFGPMGRERMIQADNAASTAIRTAVDDQAARLSTTGALPVRTPAQGAAVAADAIVDAEQVSSAGVGAAYDAVPGGGVLPQGMARVARSVLRRSRSDRSFDPSLTETAKLINEARTLARVQANRAGLSLRPTDIYRAEQMRRRFLTATNAAENTSDRTQVIQLRQAFEEEMDGVIADGLLTGGPEVMKAMKEARGLMADYARRFFVNSERTRGGATIADPAGTFIQNVIARNPSGEEVANMLFGSSSTISNRAGEQIARRLRDVLPQGSEGWDAIRQAAFLRMIQTETGGQVVSPVMTLKAFDQAMTKSGGMLKELFTADELSRMRRLFAHAARTRSPVQGSPPTGQRVLTAVYGRARELFGPDSIITQTLLAIPDGGKRARGAYRSFAATRPFAAIQRNRPSVQAGVGVAEASANAQVAPDAPVITTERGE